MAVFIDTGIFVAVRNLQDSNHKRGVELMEEALRGVHGIIYTSDYVIDEAITLALARTRNHHIAINTGKYILDSARIVKLQISHEIFQDAWRRFQELREGDLSFTDCTSLSAMQKHRVQRIISFDSGFDDHTERLR